MQERILSVGAWAYDGKYSADTAERTIKELVHGALRGIEYREAPVRAVVLYATADWCVGSPKSIAQRVRAELKKKVGYDVPLIGGSMAAMYCSTVPQPRITQGLVLVSLSSDYLWVTVDGLPGKDIDWDSNKRRQQRLYEFAQNMLTKASPRQGASAERYLFGFLPGIFRDCQGLRSYRDGELYHEIMAAFNNHFRLIGASSADSVHSIKGFQFVNDNCYESGIALAMVETDLCSGSIMAHGFNSRARYRMRIDELVEGLESGYDVECIDGKPAARVMSELTAISRTLSIGPILGTAEGSDFRILFQVRQSENRGQTVRFNRRVTLGDSLYLMAATPEQMLRASEASIRSTIRWVANPPADAALLMVFSCTSRYAVYCDQGTQWSAVVDQLRSEYPGIPVVVGLCSGEFGVDEIRQCRANNMSVIVNCLSAVLHPRTRIRKLQSDLLQAEARFSSCKSIKEVMIIILDGAIKAGAKGGQICIVDTTLGRIIGKNFGHSIRAVGSGQDWDAVLQETNYPIQKENIGTLPEGLRDWAIRVTGHSVTSGSIVLKKANDIAHHEEDILTLITRSLHAVFVPDATDPLFHCNTKSVKLGHFKTFLAIPLIGQTGLAIATLQVGFTDDIMLDRESFVSWIRYGNAAASALARTQNADLIEVEEQIATLTQEIIHDPVDVESSPYSWCDKYLKRVIELLDVNDAHIRVLHVRGKGDREYHIVGAVGRIAKIRRMTRPIINEYDQTWNTDALRKGGSFTNSKEDTKRFNKEVRLRQGTPEFQKAFQRELDKLGSGAVLPLRVGDDICGAFALGSYQEHAFGDRGQHLALVAAQYASVLLRERDAMYDRALAESGMAHMLSLLTQPCEKGADGRLRNLLSHVCTLVRADVASVYVYHNEVKKLTLYTAHNWYDTQMEGVAQYDLGEGWTGSLPLSKQSVRVIRPDDQEAIGTRKYYEKQVPLEHRCVTQRDGRIGLRLGTEESMIGAVTFTYDQGHEDRLIADDTRYRDFLVSVADTITLAVQQSLGENIRQEHERLQRVRKDVAALSSKPEFESRDWDTMLRQGLRVERVLYYSVHSAQRLSLDWGSPRNGIRRDIRNGGKGEERSEPALFEPVGTLRNLSKRMEWVSVTDQADQQLESFPDRANIEGLFAVSVPGIGDSPQGILVLINRIREPWHPFRYLDKAEQETVVEVAQVLGMFMGNTRSREELLQRLSTATRLAATGLFSSIALHKINSPLGRIRRAVDHLRTFPHVDKEEWEKRLKVIEVNLEQTVAAIQSAAQQGQPYKPSRESISKVVQEAFRVVQPAILAPHVIVDYPQRCEVKVRVNLYSMVTAVVNLVENALEAMQGSGTLSIYSKVIEENEKKWVLLFIQNTGPSLSGEEIRWLSTPGVSTNVHGRHLGMGIPLARQAIEEAGGRLTIGSPPSGGVVATIQLPVAESHADTNQIAKVEEATNHVT